MSSDPVRPVRVTIIRYVKGGQRVPAGTPGARRIKTKSRTWYAWLTVDGKRDRVTLDTEDEGQAWINLRKLLREQRDRAVGIVSPEQDHAAAPLETHLAAWEKVLRSGDVSDVHVKAVVGDVRRLAALASPSWTLLPQITADSARIALDRLRKTSGRYGANRSAGTRNHYLSHLRQFLRWCVESGRLARYPLAGVKKIDEAADRRHARRSPTDEEVAILFRHLAGLDADRPPSRRGKVSPESRSLGYRLTMATGLRLGELRSLTPESFALDADPPTVTVRRAADKRGRLAVMPLPAWLVGPLRDWLGAGLPLWQRLPKGRGDRVCLRTDVERAGIAYAVPGPDGEPLFFDFHSLRYWYVTALANQPGITVKTLMTLARHATPDLTLRLYAQTKQSELKKSVEQLPDPSRLPGGCSQKPDNP